MAGSTRLELATSGVTGRRSNQLNYDPAKEETGCGTMSAARARAASVTMLRPLGVLHPAMHRSERVGGTGLEPVTAGV